MKKIYLCHDFGAIYANVKDISAHIKTLYEYNEHAAYISPTLTFGLLYDKTPTECYYKYCTSLLKDCDMMLVFEGESDSDECLFEKTYCKKHRIPIVDYVDYCKQYRGVDKHAVSKR